MKITKIKNLNDDTIIEWQVPIKGGRTDKFSLSSGEDPRPEFKKALSALKKDMIELCEVESLDSKLIKVSGVSLSYKGEHDVMNVVITGQKSHKNSGGCLNLNSPVKPAEVANVEETAPESLLSEKCVAKVNALILEAKNYINGARSQGDLDLD